MKLSERVNPISHLKAHAAELIRGLAAGAGPVVITVHGEAKAVIQDIVSYEKTQETLALLKILALSERNIKEGKTVPLATAMRRIRERMKRERAA